MALIANCSGVWCGGQWPVAHIIDEEDCRRVKFPYSRVIWLRERIFVE